MKAIKEDPAKAKARYAGQSLILRGATELAFAKDGNYFLFLKTGEVVWSERLQGISTSVSPFVTPEGRIYCASAGISYVIQPGAKCEVLAVNDLKDGSQASPAVADGRIYLKGRKHLFCVGKK